MMLRELASASDIIHHLCLCIMPILCTLHAARSPAPFTFCCLICFPFHKTPSKTHSWQTSLGDWHFTCNLINESFIVPGWTCFVRWNQRECVSICEVLTSGLCLRLCNTLTLTFANFEERKQQAKATLNLVTQATNEHVNEYPGWNHLLFTKNWIGEGRTALLDPQVIHLRLSKLHTQSTYMKWNYLR